MRSKLGIVIVCCVWLSAEAAQADSHATAAAAPNGRDAAPEVVREPPVIVLRSLSFPLGSATVDAGSLVTLRLAAEWMEQHPESVVRIVGHSSTPGSEQLNLELSRARARGVKRVMVDFGVPEDRLEVVGRGETQPIASDATPEGRALNRRVEFVVIEGAENVRTVQDPPSPATR